MKLGSGFCNDSQILQVSVVTQAAENGSTYLRSTQNFGEAIIRFDAAFATYP